MTRALFIVSVAFCAFLIGCDEAALMKKYAPLQDEPIARRYLDLLMQGNVNQIEIDIDPSVAGQNMNETLTKMADMLPAETPRSIKVVSVHTSKQEGYSRTDITYECEFQSRWYLVGLALKRNANISTVLGLSVSPTSDSLENLNKFTLVGKSAFQYLVLALAIFSLLFSFYVFILCLRTSVLSHK
ncbi:MAG TPA: hypothetical protein VGF61_01770 [Candidatus Acidoferrum sp.]